VSSWLSERRLSAERQELALKGFDGRQVAYRIPAAGAQSLAVSS
jgi:hypothetical protein